MPRSLYISDLHLSDERPAANERFIAFMEDEAAAADELYVLGDLFEYWVGDDDLDDPFNAVIAGFFRRFSDAGRELYLLHGNRDFLVGERFSRETGARLLEDPALVGDTLLMHGDTLCTDDHDYQAWRRTARSAAWQREFLGKPLAERRRVVRGLREKSKEVIQAKPADIMDVNPEAVREALRRHPAVRLIHGHTHRPGRHLLDVDGRRCERWVLPDWYAAGGYLEVLDGKARLVRW
ncbi:MAG TPA: UDP-2,3-diacylglucosamine diphosphatase [Burkholderiales bacterium]|nr:UDP-2,3-diacylglucosamine diphosphatase [Burkholderiales bacterium]